MKKMVTRYYSTLTVHISYYLDQEGVCFLHDDTGTLYDIMQRVKGEMLIHNFTTAEIFDKSTEELLMTITIEETDT